MIYQKLQKLLLSLTFLSSFVFTQGIAFNQDCGNDLSSLNELLIEAKNISISIESFDEFKDLDISLHPIVILCNNRYLKFSDEDFIRLQKRLMNNGLLIVYDIESEYTFLNFISKIFPNQAVTNQLFSKNWLKADFASNEKDILSITLNDKIVLLGIRKLSSEKNDQLKVIGNFIFDYLLL
jgi:hypothetical protein